MNLTELNILCATAYQEQETLDHANDPKLRAVALSVECKETLEKFSTLLQSDEFKNESSTEHDHLNASQIKKLLDFLANRDREITCSAIGYSAEPQSVANLFCKALFEAIYEYQERNIELPAGECKNRAMFRIMMPSLKISGVHSIFEKSHANHDWPGYGCFLLSTALLVNKGGPIIDYADVVSLSGNLYFFANIFYSRAQSNLVPIPSHIVDKYKKSLIPEEFEIFTPWEKIRLRGFNSAGKYFFQAQDRNLAFAQGGVTPRKRLEELADGLKRGGAGGGEDGNEMVAGTSANEAVALFFDYWQKLPAEFRSQLVNCRAVGSQQTLGHVLSILQRPASDSTASCVEVNHSYIESILENSANLELLGPINANQNKNEFKKPPLSYEAARSTVAGKDDVRNYPHRLFDKLCKNVISPDLCAQLIVFCEQAEINNGYLKMLLDKFLPLLNSVSTLQRIRIVQRCLEDSTKVRREEVYERLKEDLPKWGLTFTRYKNMLNLLAPTQIADACERASLQFAQFIETTESFNHFLNFLNVSEKIISACQGLATVIPLITKTQQDICQILKPRTAAQSKVIVTILKEKNVISKVIIAPRHFKKIMDPLTRDIRAVVYQVLLEPLLTSDEMNTPEGLATVFEMLSAEQSAWVLENTPQFRKIFRTHAELSYVLMRLNTQREKVCEVIGATYLASLVNSVESFTNIFLYLTVAQRLEIYPLIRNKIFAFFRSRDLTILEFSNMLTYLTPEYRNEAYEHLTENNLIEPLVSKIKTSKELYNVCTYFDQGKREQMFRHIKPFQMVQIINQENDFNKMSKLMPTCKIAMQKLLIGHLESRFIPIYNALFENDNLLETSAFKNKTRFGKMEYLWQLMGVDPVDNTSMRIRSAWNLALAYEDLNDNALVMAILQESSVHQSWISKTLPSYFRTQHQNEFIKQARIQKIVAILSVKTTDNSLIPRGKNNSFENMTIS